jgi:hypothetical protein
VLGFVSEIKFRTKTQIRHVRTLKPQKTTKKTQNKSQSDPDQPQKEHNKNRTNPYKSKRTLCWIDLRDFSVQTHSTAVRALTNIEFTCFFDAKPFDRRARTDKHGICGFWLMRNRPIAMRTENIVFSLKAVIALRVRMKTNAPCALARKPISIMYSHENTLLSCILANSTKHRSTLPFE